MELAHVQPSIWSFVYSTCK
jgi:hypothetical protein